MTASRVTALNGLCLPPDSVLLRDYPRPAHRRSAEYEAKFDRHTVVYDAFHDVQRGEVVLLCPRLLNLTKPFRDGLRIDGQRRPMHRKTYKRFEIWRGPAGGADARISLTMGGAAWQTGLAPSQHDLFAGRNVLATLSKDNDLDWITDWALHHKRSQGADAVLFFDNGSSRYAPQDVETALLRSGIDLVQVVSCPAPYGPPPGGSGKFEVPGAFLQAALLNLKRIKYLSRARAVLYIDIDEMVSGPDDVTVFDAATRARLGLCAFHGRLAYAPGQQRGCPQSDHTHTRIGCPPAKPKWAVRPDSVTGRGRWGVHRMADLLFPLTVDPRFLFWHCQGTTTGWKPGKAGSTIPGIEPSARMQADWARFLS